MLARSIVVAAILVALFGCVDPMFSADPPPVGVTQLGNVPAEYRQPAPGAVRDARPQEARTEAAPPPKAPAKSLANTAANPLYFLAILAIVAGVAVAWMFARKRKSRTSKPKSPPEG